MQYDLNECWKDKGIPLSSHFLLILLTYLDTALDREHWCIANVLISFNDSFIGRQHFLPRSMQIFFKCIFMSTYTVWYCQLIPISLLICVLHNQYHHFQPALCLSGKKISQLLCISFKLKSTAQWSVRNLHHSDNILKKCEGQILEKQATKSAVHLQQLLSGIICASGLTSSFDLTSSLCPSSHPFSRLLQT